MPDQQKSVRSDDPEALWLAETYRPGATQLTVRAVIVGMLLGGVMCISNLYVFFKTGWSMGVTITAAILAYALFRGLSAIGLAKRPLGLLENNALITVSSGAGYMTGGGNMAAFGALLMIPFVAPPTLHMIAWFAAIAALGVFCAIPIKRQLINREGLVFPTGTATAETLRVIHATPPPENQQSAGRTIADSTAPSGSSQAKALGIAAGFAALLTWFREAKVAWMPFNVPGTIPVPITIAGETAAKWTLAIKTEVVLVGAGALMSFRTAWSLLLGSLLTYGVLAPQLHADGRIAEISYKAIVQWTVWPGAALLVASGLTSFALDWRSVARSFSGLAGLFGRKKTVEDPMDAIECPGWWFPAGFIVLGPVVVALMAVMFQIPVWAGCIAVPLAIVMGFVAARVTGDTDVTPTKALGPVTQLVYGVITPGNLSGNIMSANVTGGIGLHAADLLTTLKTGWLLGANPRAQFFAQLFGVVVGAALIVPAFNLLIPDVTVLGGADWPAPSCLVWAGVSKAFANGVGALDPLARQFIAIGAALGIALALLEKFAPKRAKPFVPSPSGLGIAMVVPGSNGIAMFLGGAIAEIVRRNWRKLADAFVTPVASGFIAGESLMGVAVALLKATGNI
ncbi:MAG: OPT/YSL family transporter [Planctomycetota bacterium]|nr:OPT/YSL family transporter [Planctomycetota bacterium]